jgi:hypothetical protein
MAQSLSQATEEDLMARLSVRHAQTQEFAGLVMEETLARNGRLDLPVSPERTLTDQALNSKLKEYQRALSESDEIIAELVRRLRSGR